MIFARPRVGPIPGFVTGLSVCLLSVLRISRFKEIRLSMVYTASSVSLGLTRVSLGCTRVSLGCTRVSLGCTRVSLGCPKWSKMVRNGPKLSEMVRNGPKLSRWEG
jgi:hypothetical protein